jgi:antitoxin PrlF
LNIELPPVLDNNESEWYNQLMQVVPMNERNTSERTSSVSPKGQVTIPAEIRQLLGVRPRDRVAFEVTDGQVLIRPARRSLDSLYRSVPALERPVSDKEMTQLVQEEHVLEVAEEGKGS